MLIKRIAIENIRCFENVALDLTRPDGGLAGFTVLAGRNGSGKTTFLKALVLAGYGPLLAQNLEPGLASWIRAGSNDRKRLTGKIKADTDSAPLFGLRIEMLKHGLRVAPTLDPETQSEMLKRFTELAKPGDELHKLIESFIDRDLGFRKSIVMVAFGSSRRISTNSPEVNKLAEGSTELGRVASLFREDVSLIESVNWLREEIYLRRLEGSKPHEELERNVLNLLDDGLLPDGARVEGVDSDGLWIRQHGVKLNLREMSDGYRTVAALVLDIVRHLHGAYGELKIEKSGKGRKNPVRVLNEAAVLIDEIEMHLHVSWQRRIGFWLKEHFPAIQFIVTTHSPFVCQAADPGGLIRLPAPGENRSVERVSDQLYYTVVNGSLDEAVISELFGLETPYSAEAEALRDEVAEIEARLIAGKPSTRDRKRLSNLRQKLPRSMSSDVEIAVRMLDKK